MLTAHDLIDGKNEFTIYTPGVVDIVQKGGSNLEEERPIGGWCSTESRDRQDEIVVAKGLDFDEFVKFGFYNDNHKQETAAVLGEPRLAELRKNRWWTEGNLLKGYEPADRIWQLAKALNTSTRRKLGFSIEGKVLERGHDNRIIRAKIRHVAITNSPVNTDCSWDILSKAFGSLEEVEAVCARKAIMAGVQSPAHSGGAALRVERDNEPLKDLSFNDAVIALKKARPHLTWMGCEQLVRIMFNLEERRN